MGKSGAEDGKKSKAGLSPELRKKHVVEDETGYAEQREIALDEFNRLLGTELTPDDFKNAARMVLSPSPRSNPASVAVHKFRFESSRLESAVLVRYAECFEDCFVRPALAPKVLGTLLKATKDAEKAVRICHQQCKEIIREAVIGEKPRTPMMWQPMLKRIASLYARDVGEPFPLPGVIAPLKRMRSLWKKWSKEDEPSGPPESPRKKVLRSPPESPGRRARLFRRAFAKALIEYFRSCPRLADDRSRFEAIGLLWVVTDMRQTKNLTSSKSDLLKEVASDLELSAPRTAPTPSSP